MVQHEEPAAATIAREKEAELLQRGCDAAFPQRAKDYLTAPGISVVRDALAACAVARTHSMHDPTGGGLATGLHEVALAASVGLGIDGDAIPVLPESAKLRAEFGLDPMGTISSGTLALTCAPGEATTVRQAIEQTGTACVQIGRVPKEAGVTWMRGGRAEPLPLFVKDEIARLL